MLNPNFNLETIRDEGYEAGIMRMPCVHTYAPYSVYAKAFEAAFKNGRRVRELLDQRGMVRVQTHIEKTTAGYEWRVVIEGDLVANGVAETHKQAVIETDFHAVSHIEKLKK